MGQLLFAPPNVKEEAQPDADLKTCWIATSLRRGAGVAMTMGSAGRKRQAINPDAIPRPQALVRVWWREGKATAAVSDAARCPRAERRSAGELVNKPAGRSSPNASTKPRVLTMPELA